MNTSEKRIEFRSENLKSIKYPNFLKIKSVSFTDLYRENLYNYVRVIVLITSVPVWITFKNFYLKIIKELRGS